MDEPDSPGSLVTTGCVNQSITTDQTATTYSCSASSAGGNAGPDAVTIRRDATPPTLSFSGNAGSYNVAQALNIGCSATDNLAGIATTCTGINRPAYALPLGTTTITRTASDNAGNSGTGSTSFTITVDPASLCTLTRQFIQGSAAYQSLSQAARRRVDATVAAACTILTRIGPKLHPAEKANYITAYKDAVHELAHAGWLTTSQANTLTTLADAL